MKNKINRLDTLQMLQDTYQKLSKARESKCFKRFEDAKVSIEGDTYPGRPVTAIMYENVVLLRIFVSRRGIVHCKFTTSGSTVTKGCYQEALRRWCGSVLCVTQYVLGLLSRRYVGSH